MIRYGSQRSNDSVKRSQHTVSSNLFRRLPSRCAVFESDTMSLRACMEILDYTVIEFLHTRTTRAVVDIYIESLFDSRRDECDECSCSSCDTFGKIPTWHPSHHLNY